MIQRVIKWMYIALAAMSNFGASDMEWIQRQIDEKAHR